MKALILAAGLGSRLAPLTNDRPKCLIEVNGTPILCKQIENLKENDVKDVTVVAGYKEKILRDMVESRYPYVNIISNQEFSETNNMFSAWLAKGSMRGEGFLMMNADVFFDPSVITALIRCPAENAIVTDIGSYWEESMKVTEVNGRLAKISKSIAKGEALGASIDVYKFSPEGAEAFFTKCEEYILTRGERRLWSEVAINDILSIIEFRACPLVGRWLEIDNLDDLAAARRIFVDQLLLDGT